MTVSFLLDMTFETKKNTHGTHTHIEQILSN